MASALDKSHVDLESCDRVRDGGDHHLPAAAAGEGRGGSLSSSSGENKRDPCHSSTEIVDVSSQKKVSSSVPECSADMDLEIGITKTKPHAPKAQKDCRICHMSLDPSNQESGIPIELGCSCKDDLGAAHKHCAEAWFKIRGNKTCEICGATARNVAGVSGMELVQQWNEANDATATPGVVTVVTSETQRFWQGHRFLNFLLACMVFAFVISWLFHFNVP